MARTRDRSSEYRPDTELQTHHALVPVMIKRDTVYKLTTTLNSQSVITLYQLDSRQQQLIPKTPARNDNS